jgi:PAS domain S-box-containing protein
MSRFTTPFRDLSIERKFRIVLIVSAVLVLVLATTTYLILGIRTLKEQEVNKMKVLARAITQNIQAALAFNDVAQATQTLKSIQAEPDVVAGIIYKPRGDPFAWFYRVPREQLQLPPLQSHGHFFRNQHLHVFEAVILDGQRVGTVYLQSQLTNVMGLTRLYLAVTVSVLLASVLLAFLISNLMQRLITRPILRLAEVARSISRDKEYSVRAVAEGRDEVGELIQCFNEMLDQIQRKDGELKGSHQNLEKRVNERTRELQQSEGRFRAVSESANDAIVSASSEGVIIYWNPAAARIFGYSEREILGKPLDFLIAPDHRKKYRTELDKRRERSFATLGVFETRCTRKDGGLLDVEVSVAFWFSGEELHVTEIIRDITARKQTEAEVKVLNDELTKRIEELESVNQELETFAYSISHDLRAPLRHIGGFAVLLKERLGGAIDKESQYFVKTISDSAKNMGILIDALLAFSRTSRMEMSHGRVQPKELIDSVIHEFADDLRGRRIDWHIVPDFPAVEGDASLLRIVFVNLISNALKYTSRLERPAVIEIGCQKSPEGEQVFFVRDNGVGFDMEFADRLFGVFQRLHRQEEFEGTGIGLATVRRIVNRHGGRIWAESAVGQGATFYFTLPVAPQNHANGANTR